MQTIYHTETSKYVCCEEQRLCRARCDGGVCFSSFLQLVAVTTYDTEGIVSTSRCEIYLSQVKSLWLVGLCRRSVHDEKQIILRRKNKPKQSDKAVVIINHRSYYLYWSWLLIRTVFSRLNYNTLWFSAN